MDRLLIIVILALAGCDAPRRGGTVRIAGCVEGRAVACMCSDGRSGTQVCLPNDQFSACECSGDIDGGEDEDGGSDEDGGLEGDAGFDDGGRFDSGFPPEDVGVRDVGSPDTGFDSGIRDTGAGDADAGVFDTGAGDGGFDGGVRDTGFPDANVPPADGGLPPFDGGTGGPCSSDLDCNQGSPFPVPVYICEQNVCEYSCLYYEFFGTPICVSPQVCDFSTGRCL